MKSKISHHCTSLLVFYFLVERRKWNGRPRWGWGGYLCTDHTFIYLAHLMTQLPNPPCQPQTLPVDEWSICQPYLFVFTPFWGVSREKVITWWFCIGWWTSFPFITLTLQAYYIGGFTLAREALWLVLHRTLLITNRQLLFSREGKLGWNAMKKQIQQACKCMKKFHYLLGPESMWNFRYFPELAVYLELHRN